jgi:hypothetical protein
MQIMELTWYLEMKGSEVQSLGSGYVEKHTKTIHSFFFFAFIQQLLYLSTHSI